MGNQLELLVFSQWVDVWLVDVERYDGCVCDDFGAEGRGYSLSKSARRLAPFGESELTMKTIRMTATAPPVPIMA